MDKTEEKRVLRMVYRETEYKFFDENSEKPDFILRDEADIIFGVEVTEYFSTESSARLIKVPNYLDKLLDENIIGDKKFIHKHDKNIFKIDTFQLLDDNGNAISEFKGVFQDNPSRTTYLEGIEAIIKLKGEKYKHYSTSCKYHNFIINDRSGAFTFELEDFYETFFTSAMLSSTLDSPFKEISIIIVNKEDHYYINLKQLIFINKVYLFCREYKEIKNEASVIINQVIVDLVFYLIKAGFKGAGLYFERDKMEVLFAGMGLEIFDKQLMTLKINHYQYFKQPQYEDLKAFLNGFPLAPDDSIYKKFKKYESIRIFKGDSSVKCYNN